MHYRHFRQSHNYSSNLHCQMIRPFKFLIIPNRLFHYTAAVRSIDFAKEYESLKLFQVADLPLHRTVALSSQSFKGKTKIDPEKSPWVLLHGLFGAKQNYSSVGRRVCEATSRDVIGIDLRNHGSTIHAAPHDYTHLAHDTIEHIESMGTKVMLAGHLMGAKVAMLVSLMRPDLVEKLVVIDNCPESQSLSSQFTKDLLGMCHVERDRSLRELPQAAKLLKVDKLLFKYEKDPLVRLFLMSNLQRRGSKHDNLPVKFRVPVLNFLKMDTLGAMGQWPESVQHLKFHGPVKVMRGTQSDFVTDLDGFKRHFTDFLVVDFDSGHWLVSEQPDRFVEEMIAFTASQE